MFQPQKLTPAVKGIFIAILAGFVLEIAGIVIWDSPTVFGYLGFVPIRFFSGMVWQVLTYPFLHDHTGIFHLVFNCIILYMLGPNLERIWGSRRFLGFFFVSAMGGALLHSIVWLVLTLSGVQNDYAVVPVIGASGALYGLMYAFSRFYGNAQVLFFFVIPMKMKTFVMIMLAMDMFYGFRPLLTGEISSVAHFAHLGGFLLGWLYMKWRGMDLRGGGGGGGGLGGIFRKKMSRSEVRSRLSVISKDDFDDDDDLKPRKYPVTWN